MLRADPIYTGTPNKYAAMLHVQEQILPLNSQQPLRHISGALGSVGPGKSKRAGPKVIRVEERVDA